MAENEPDALAGERVGDVNAPGQPVAAGRILRRCHPVSLGPGAEAVLRDEELVARVGGVELGCCLVPRDGIDLPGPVETHNRAVLVFDGPEDRVSGSPPPASRKRHARRPWTERRMESCLP